MIFKIINCYLVLNDLFIKESKTEVRKKNVPKNDNLQVKAGLPITNNVEVKPLVQHVLSMEHQIFYEKVL